MIKNTQTIRPQIAGLAFKGLMNLQNSFREDEDVEWSENCFTVNMTDVFIEKIWKMMRMTMVSITKISANPMTANFR